MIWEAIFSAIRGLGFAAGLYHLVGLRFAVSFGVLITRGQIFAYRRGMRPGLACEAARPPRVTQRQFVGTVIRTMGYSTAAVLCGIFAQHLEHPWRFALRVGLVTGIVTGVGIAVNPFIEYYADRLPQRVLGAAGIALIFCGFMLQSFQYWVSLLDVHVV